MYENKIRDWGKLEKKLDDSMKRFQHRNAALDREANRAKKFEQFYGGAGKALSFLAKKNKMFAGPARAALIAESIANTYAAAISQLKIPWPMNLVAMAMTIGGGMASVKKIKDQKFALGGPVMGPLHSQGGVLAELEGGEHIWSRQEVSNAGGHQGVQALRAQQGSSFITSIRRHENTTRRAAYIGVTG